METYSILKYHCRLLFFAGSGNFWFERDIWNDRYIFYRLYSYILFFSYILITLLEISAAIFGDFPRDEKSDAIAFATSHSLVMIKIMAVISNKRIIKKLNQDMVNTCEIYEDEEIKAAKHKTISINIAANFIIVYGSAIFYVVEGLWKMFAGSHFITLVTYYPAYEDNSLQANSFRLFATIILLAMLMTMISVDSFTITNIIMFKYKIMTLRRYFEGLRRQYDMTSLRRGVEVAGKALTDGVEEGILKHVQILRMADDIYAAFGTVMSLQLCLSSGTAVSLLLQVALATDLTVVIVMKIFFFVCALFFMLGLLLCNAGEITYQASLLSDSIFYCGWHLVPVGVGAQARPRRNLRSIVLIACAQAQRPLLMKAFKMIELTYGTFLLVVRNTYSVFALLYARNK